MIHVFLTGFARRIHKNRRWGIFAVAILLVVAILGNTICFYFFEGAGGGNSEITLQDSLWYSVISITTIGYGDFYATTTGARIATFFFVVLLGLTAFSLFFGMLIDWFTEFAIRGDQGMMTVHATNHTLLVHFPSEARVRQLISELKSASSREIVIISERLEKLPFQEDNVMFVRGSTVSPETYRRAGIENASSAVVLATSYEDHNSDAVVASAASVIDHLKPEIHLVAECLDDDHRMLFKSVKADAIVSALRITGNLLVQESQDPGISQLFDMITSHHVGDTLFSTVVAGELTSNYDVISTRLMENDVNLIAVNRGKETLTKFRGLQPQSGDNAVYLTAKRKSWVEFEKIANQV